MKLTKSLAITVSTICSILVALITYLFTVTYTVSNQEGSVAHNATDIESIKSKFYQQFATETLDIFKIESSPYYAVVTKTGIVFTQPEAKFIISGKILNTETAEEITADAIKIASKNIIQSRNRKLALDSIISDDVPQDTANTDSKALADAKKPANSAPIEPKFKPSNTTVSSQKGVLQTNDPHTARALPQINSPSVPAVKQDASSAPRSASSSAQEDASVEENLLKGLAQLSIADRQAEGPKIAAMLLPEKPDSLFVIYPANKNVPFKGTITVATDYTCSNCQNLHKKLKTYTDEGYKIRYYPYLRGRIDNGFDQLKSFNQSVQYSLVKPLNLQAQYMVNAYCDNKSPASYNQLMMRKSFSVMGQSSECEQQYRQLKVMGDLLFSGRTPIMVIGDKSTPLEQRSYVIGFEKRWHSAQDLINYGTTPDFAR